MKEKTHAEIVLEKIEAVIENRAGDTLSEYTVEGQSVVKMPLNQLIDLRNKYRTERAKEIRLEQMKEGKTPNKIKIRFSH